jgi:voltage-gated potassium channel
MFCVRVTQIPDHLTARRAGQAIAAVTLVVGIAGGILMWLIDREDFPTVGSGLWWAIQTITTVGYGDNVPQTRGGQFLAALVMVTGLGFMSVVTAAISAAFIESARRKRSGREAITLDHIAERLDQLERLMEDRFERDQRGPDRGDGESMQQRGHEPGPG